MCIHDPQDPYWQGDSGVWNVLQKKKKEQKHDCFIFVCLRVTVYYVNSFIYNMFVI